MLRLRLVTSQGSPYPSRSPRAHPSGWTRTQGLSHRDSHAPPLFGTTPVRMWNWLTSVSVASRRDLNVLRGVVDGMVRADPRLRREAENVRAPIRVATRIQRAWRARRRLKGDASASSP